VVGPTLGEADGEEDDQHREVGQGQDLLDDEEQVGRLVDALDAAPEQDQLPGQEEAEEEGGDQPAQDEVLPVGSGAPLQLLRHARDRHVRQKGSDPDGEPGRFG